MKTALLVVIAFFAVLQSVYACPEVPKGLSVKGSSFERLDVGLNCAIRVTVGDTALTVSDLDKFASKPTPIKNNDGKVIGIAERKGKNVYFFSVRDDKKDINLPYIVISVKGENAATLEMRKGKQILGTADLQSGACSRGIQVAGRSDFEMEGFSYKTAGQGCGSGLAQEKFTPAGQGRVENGLSR